MSTIVAVQKHAETVIAFDCLNRVGHTRSVNAVATKAFCAGDSVVATAGFAVYQIILPHYIDQLKVAPSLSSEEAVFDFFLGFWRALRERYHFVNDTSDDDDPSPFADLSAEFLVANKHGIFRVKEILSVLRFERFCAIGSGSPQAEGALRVLYDQDESAKGIAQRAVEVACEFDSSSGGEVKVIETS